ncbi:hypothetical protein BDV98DRAFT_647067 [Pterulicium gracile]|uniref:tRNA-splicing endonuclease subunit Sen34 n=1 Tax=Pterulicium gracile TaxID=1884261 RepID=A0A5C3QZR9_9AGAR|nr:hypothetical protein BDV98DRAFT_647067 [Pterula gracilis]
MSNSAVPPPPVHIHVAQQTAFVWDVDDIATLRSKHHICGILTGTLPQHSQQNVFLGPPLVLMPEEVVFLVNKRAAVLVNDPVAQNHSTSLSSLTVDQLRKWARVQRGLADEQLAKGQVAEGTNSRIESKKTSDDAVRKRAEREEKRRQKAALAAAATEGESLLSAPPEPTPTPSTAPPAESVITITIPTTATTHEWYNPPASTIFDTIESAQDEGFWLFPRSEMEQSRCAIFRDLWEKGHFMGGGTKFGAEYLVYPGDPLRYHSHQAASVLESPTAPMSAMEIVAHGRLGTATKKAHLLCAWDKKAGKAQYMSIEWAGFG